MSSDINETRKLIENLDLDLITKNFIRKYKVSELAAKECEKLYKNFLFLSFKYKDKKEIAPSEDVDLFWHEHILDTKKYAEDCNSIFGEIRHHYPYAGLPGAEIDKTKLKSIFNETQELHKKEFGYYMYDVNVGFFQGIKLSIFSRS